MIGPGLFGDQRQIQPVVAGHSDQRLIAQAGAGNGECWVILTDMHPRRTHLKG